MLKNSLSSALRQLRRSPVYSSLNVLGLAVGSAGFILLLLWVANELGTDRSWPDAARTFRVTTDVRLQSGQRKSYALSTSGLAGALKAEYPDVAASTRVLPTGQILLRHGEASFYEETFYYADADFLAVFPLTLLSGNVAEALKGPRTLLISRAMAAKYFGAGEPLGKTVQADNSVEYQVVGVFDPPRGGSHIRADFVANPGQAPFFNHPTWNALGIYTYIRLAPGVTPGGLEAKIQDLAAKYAGPNGKDLFTYRLQPVTTIRLRSDREAEFSPVVGLTQVRLLAAVAVLILAVSCVNFVNLATARSGRRAREVGVRKVLGARRGGLFRLFLSESFVSSAAAAGLGLVLAHLALPVFNSLWETSLDLRPGADLPLFLGLAMVVGLLSGCYPALVLSSFRPVHALRGRATRAAGAAVLRKALIVFQFSASILLFVAVGVVADQLRYLRTKDLGFDRDQVLAVRLRDEDVIRNYEGVKSEFLADPGIVAATTASSLPGFQAATLPYVPDAFDGNSILVRTLFVDHDFIPAMRVRLAAGRSFRRDHPTDIETGLIINRAAQSRFGWKEALGKTIACVNRDEPGGGQKGTVIGVIENIHVRSLHQQIEPVILRIRPAALSMMFLKVRRGHLERVRTLAEDRMKALQPRFPPETFFLDEGFDRIYANERRLGRIFKTFSLITVLVACLGLFGLAAYAAEQRTKEIGVRKVLGATTSRVLWLLTREFAGLVTLSALLAWPAGYFLMKSWLRTFAYRTSLDPAVFVLAGAAALAIAMLTVGAQAYRAAAANPVASIRYE
ncbi:MAG: ABC transporter permease [Candidatus Aminicenantes bacterium]|nr:ABC transporter permease [Candidatus Aminicenantes bacterium]